jgi:hypothetical protein
VLDTNRFVDLTPLSGAASTVLLSISPRLKVGDFRQPFIGTSAFHVAELRGSPHQLTFCRSSDVVGEKLNPQILVNLNFTCIPIYVTRNANTLRLQILQLPGMAVSSGPSDFGMRSPSKDGWVAYKAAHRFWCIGHFCQDRDQVCSVFQLPFFPPGWRMPSRSTVINLSLRYRDASNHCIDSPKNWTGLGFLMCLAVLTKSTEMMFETLMAILQYRSQCSSLPTEVFR